VGRLERGLALLDGLTCAVIVGDIPDLSNSPGIALDAGQSPDAETIQELNSTILAWAAVRSERIVIPLSQLFRRHSDAATEECGGALLQRDGLHPTRAGLRRIGLSVIQLLVQNEFATVDDFNVQVLEQDISCGEPIISSNTVGRIEDSHGEPPTVKPRGLDQPELLDLAEDRRPGKLLEDLAPDGLARLSSRGCYGGAPNSPTGDRR